MKTTPFCYYLILAFAYGAPTQLFSQTNSWTSPSSGNWHDLTWSLGTRPNLAQSIFITNTGSKAVAIQPTTPVNFPASMTISNLSISAPNGFANTLLLNFSGTGTPLKITSNCNIGINGILNNQFGGLLFEGSSTPCLIQGGSLLQQGGAWTALNGSTVLVGAQVDLLNVSTTLRGIESYSTSYFVQNGGTSYITNLYLYSGNYFLTNGVFAGSITLGDFGSTIQTGNLFQLGGTNNANLYISKGTYTLDNGLFVGSIALGRESTFYQTGGVVRATSIEHFNFRPGPFYFSSSQVKDATNHVGSVYIGAGNYIQSGGSLFVTNTINVAGFFDTYHPVGFSSYTLSSGALASANCNLGTFGGFSHATGIHTIAGNLSISRGEYIFSNGRLLSSNILVEYNWPVDGFVIRSQFTQWGGSNHVGNLLSVSGNYAFGGGQLTANHIVVQTTPEAYFLITNGAPSLAISNAGTFTTSGRLILQGSIQQLGTLILAGNAIFDFSQIPGQLKFRHSSAAPWSDGLLNITNWVGLVGGGGQNRFIVGTNSSGLDSSQLSKVRFINPSGFASGTYYAKILATGEVVPTTSPILLTTKLGPSLTFSWPGSFTLESSTNVSGPYLPVAGAISPYTNQLPGSQRFFRLKQ